MIVHRLLDAFFRTLDTVDAVRDRVDRALGREPRPDPWAVEWPPPDDTPVGAEPPGGEWADKAEREASEADKPAAEKPRARKASPSDGASAKDKGATAGAKKAAKKTAPQKAAEGEEPAPKKGEASSGSKKKPGRKKKSSSKRKGSVDRSGKDLVSERADHVVAHLQKLRRPVITEEADLDGKKVLARVVWALGEAKAAGVTDGLTTNDVSALLSRAANIEVFATNIGRACRDHKDLIAEGPPDGRSKRYVLTEAGDERAAEVETTP